MPNIVLGIFGAGGHGKETLAIVRERESVLSNLGLSLSQIVFIEDNPRNTQLHGVPILDESEFTALEAEKKYLTIALGDSLKRAKIAARFRETKVEQINVISSKAHIDSTVVIGLGAIVSPFTFISSDVNIGVNFQANTRVSVSHDCQLGDYVTLSPGVICNGNVEIGDNVFVGSGAIIRNGNNSKKLIIGRNSVIGMGAVVIHDVEPFTVVVGNPARIISKSAQK